MVYKQPRQKILIALIILFTFITFVSGYNFWKFWVIFPISFFFWYLVGKYSHSYFPDYFLHRILHKTLFSLKSHIDIMFMNESEYLYEPNYYNWKDINEPDY